MTRISVAIDFSKYPAGRFRTDGPHSGQRFREDFLAPSLNKGPALVVLDAPLGYGSSFLEEAFGGLLREHGFTEAQLRKVLTLESQERGLVAGIWRYIADAQSKLASKASK